MRGRPANDKSLLVTQKGMALDLHNLRDCFKRAATLAFVKMNWPTSDRRSQLTNPLEVAQSIFSGRTVGFDGRLPTDPVKVEARKRRCTAIEALVKLLKPVVESCLADRPMYALRHTHITWARRFVDYDCVRAQVEHAGRDIQEEHYNDD